MWLQAMCAGGHSTSGELISIRLARKAHERIKQIFLCTQIHVELGIKLEL